MYEKIPEPEDDENDMLDLAFGLTETSVPPPLPPPSALLSEEC